MSNIYNTGNRVSGISPMERVLRKSVLVPSGCIEFGGSTIGNGYGHTCVSYPLPEGKSRQQWEYAHRIVYQGHWDVLLTSSEIVMHTCDNPVCVNIDHLLEGDQLSNIADRDAKGRGIGGGILSLREKEEIVSRWDGGRGEGQMALALEFGVSQPNVSRICHSVRLHPRDGNCLRGHPLSGANLYVSPKGMAQCRECMDIRALARAGRVA